MRTKSDVPGDPVKKTVGTTGNIPADQFPEISENQKNIMPTFEAMEQEQQTGAYEIVPGMTVEKMTAMFFNADALIEPRIRFGS